MRGGTCLVAGEYKAHEVRKSFATLEQRNFALIFDALSQRTKCGVVAALCRRSTCKRARHEACDSFNMRGLRCQQLRLTCRQWGSSPTGRTICHYSTQYRGCFMLHAGCSCILTGRAAVEEGVGGGERGG